MQLYFHAIAEPTAPGVKWERVFHHYWPAYRTWLHANKISSADLETAQAALQAYMPEMIPAYERFCHIAQADALAAHFLTGFQPPAYISGCSQAVMAGDTVQLVRNYDYHPDLIEGIQWLTAWHGKQVIGTSDCLWGLLDGMNEDGLVVSLTFGGRKEVGKGFGIPFILRYVLEFCSTVEEAVEVLVRVPSHMSFNVTVLDRSGTCYTVQLAPDKEPVVTPAAYVTNHQGQIDWPENALFNKTVERAALLERTLQQDSLQAEELVASFLKPPLYSAHFNAGFGTLYTAIYRPVEGTVQLAWPEGVLDQSFADFREQKQLVQYPPSTNVITPVWDTASSHFLQGVAVAPELAWEDEASATMDIAPVNDENPAGVGAPVSETETPMTWDRLTHYWANIGRAYWGKWKK